MVEYISTTHVWFETSRVSTTHVWFETSRVSTTHVWFETSRVRGNYWNIVWKAMNDLGRNVHSYQNRKKRRDDVCFFVLFSRAPLAYK